MKVSWLMRDGETRPAAAAAAAQPEYNQKTMLLVFAFYTRCVCDGVQNSCANKKE